MPRDTQDKPVVLITGNNGLLGKAIVEALRQRVQIVGLDKDGEPQPPPEVECVCFDVTDPASVRRGLERVAYAYGRDVASVIHLAAYYDFSGEPSDLYDEVTVRGTGRLLDGLEDFNVQQFIFSSTMLVHEHTEPGRPFTEDAPLEGKWDYPKSKIATEELIREKRGDTPALIFRIAGVYTDYCDSIPIAHQIQRIFENRLTSHVFPGNISHGQAFVHIDDVVAAVEAAFERREQLEGFQPILIGEPETYSYEQLQRELARLIHHDDDWKMQEIAKGVAETGAWIQGKIPGAEDPFIKPWMIEMADDHYELDIARARALLEWSPKRRLIDTLPLMVEHLRDDPQAWYERHGLEAPDFDEEPMASALRGEKAGV